MEKMRGGRGHGWGGVGCGGFVGSGYSLRPVGSDHNGFSLRGVDSVAEPLSHGRLTPTTAKNNG